MAFAVNYRSDSWIRQRRLDFTNLYRSTRTDSRGIAGGHIRSRPRAHVDLRHDTHNQLPELQNRSAI